MGTKSRKKKLFKELRTKFETIEEIGYGLQEEGQKLVTYGKFGQEVTAFLGNEIDKYEELASNHPELAADLDSISVWANYTDYQLGGVLGSLAADMSSLGRHTAAAATASTSGSSAVFILHGHASYIQTQNQERNIYDEYQLRKPAFIETAKVQAQLDRYLDNIDPELNQRRKGAWQTLNSMSLDKKPEAAHTMRDVLAKLISRWESNDQVKQADWWVFDSRSKDGVSPRQRFRLLLFGPKAEVASQEELDQVKQSVDDIYKQDAYLKKVAHGSQKGSIELVESVMHAIESTMLLIIEVRRRYFKDESAAC